MVVKLNMPAMFYSRLSLRHWAVVSLCLCASLAGHAQEVTLVQGPLAALKVQDVLSEWETLSADTREKMLEQPESLRPWVDHLYLRRALATQARRDGVAQKPAVQRQLAQVQERLLAEAQLEHVEEAALPPSQAIDKQLQTIYKAEPQRFAIPAQTHARHILIQGQDAAARAKAEKILAELHAGADFEKLAREHSNDSGSAAKGGDLGFFPTGKMVPEFEQAAAGLKNPGDLSSLIPTPFGFHIIRLEGRRSAGFKPFEEVKESLRAETLAKLKNEARKKEVDRVRALSQSDTAALDAFIAEKKALAEKSSKAE